MRARIPCSMCRTDQHRYAEYRQTPPYRIVVAACLLLLLLFVLSFAKRVNIRRRLFVAVATVIDTFSVLVAAGIARLVLVLHIMSLARYFTCAHRTHTRSHRALRANEEQKQKQKTKRKCFVFIANVHV